MEKRIFPAMEASSSSKAPTCPADGKIAKLRKLQDMRQEMPHMSKAKEAKGMRAADRHLIRTSTAYGPLVYEKKLVCTDGSKIALKFVNYLTFLCHAYQAGGGFHRCLNTLLARHGSLSLILYSDEISPGNPLASKVGRKCWVVYCAIKEMKAFLSDTDAWVCLFVCRSSLVSTLAASMSQVMREILENTFRNPLCDVRT